MAYPPLTDYERHSPEWWLYRLSARLDQEAGAARMLRAYYDGTAKLEYAGKKFRETFGDLFRDWSDNFLALVVDAVAERLIVEGFRVPTPKPSGAAPGDGTPTQQQQQGDDAAWAIWQANHLDADSHLAHLDSLVVGCGYVSVWGSPDGQPVIAVEDPCEVVVDHAPGNRRVRRAALKRWRDDDDLIMATLYLPDGVYKFVSDKPLKRDSGQHLDSVRYERRVVRVDPADPDSAPEPWPLDNPVGVVPIVPLPNRPRTSGAFESEIDQFRPLQDGLNKIMADMMVASEYTAFPQRWVTGIDVPTDDNGNPMEPFRAGPGNLWSVDPVEEGEQPTTFGQFPAADLKPYVDAIAMIVQHLSSRSRTPPHYLLGQAGVFPSGESLKSAETGLVAKTRLKMRPLGEAWEEIERLAFRFAGDDQRAAAIGMETMWRNPESRSQAETTDAAIKLQALGVPQEALWAYIGASPQEIARWRQMRAEEALLIGSAFTGGGPPPTTTTPPAGGQVPGTRPVASVQPDRTAANGNTPPAAPVPGR